MGIETSRAGRSVLGVALAVSLGACGGGSDSPTATPVVPTERLIAEGAGVALGAGFVLVQPFSANVAGGIRMTVDWTLPENDIDIVMALGECDLALLQAGECQVITFSDSTTAKPEQLAVTRSTGASYTLLVLNNGPGDESISYQVVLVTAS